MSIPANPLFSYLPGWDLPRFSRRHRLAAALSGLAAAHLLAHRVNPAHARRAAITLAAIATLFTLIHGMRP